MNDRIMESAGLNSRPKVENDGYHTMSRKSTLYGTILPERRSLDNVGDSAFVILPQIIDVALSKARDCYLIRNITLLATKMSV